MCRSDLNSSLEALVRQAAGETGASVLSIAPTCSGSRRRRLWELDGHAHCPVIGVCLPIASLRAVVGKALGGQALADDYELHCGAIAECKRRSTIAEAIQRELDRRCALALNRSAKAKTAEALAEWWREASQGQDLAGALWATLTHPRCDALLETRVLGEVHMLQHQVGVARRHEAQRFEALSAENAALARELGEAQQRIVRAAEEHARRCDVLNGEIVQLRARLISRETIVAAQREEEDQQRAAASGAAQAGPRLQGDPARAAERAARRIAMLEDALLTARQDAQRQRRRAETLAQQLQAARAGAAPEDDVPPPAAGSQPDLDARNVLCVGGRPASVPVYRDLIERTGGRFLHHDGGEEDNVAKLDSTLAAADLVICQAGCISHDAYWRVKDHCKRTGKRCVFVESPSASGLKRALADLHAAVATQPMENA
jgi:hypothetical protein